MNLNGVLLLFFGVLVPTLFGQSNTNALPPLAPAYGEMPPTFWDQHQTGLLAAGVGFMVLAGGISWLVFRSRPRPAVPPFIVAMESLNALRGRPEDGRTLSEISQILRRYVATVAGWPADERTTAEFSAALAGAGPADAELSQRMVRLLRECDDRKFSPAAAGTPLQAADRALAMVTEMQKRQAASAIQT